MSQLYCATKRVKPHNVLIFRDGNKMNGDVRGNYITLLIFVYRLCD